MAGIDITPDAQGQGARSVRSGRQAAACGDGPHLGVRLHPGGRDPPQGRRCSRSCPCFWFELLDGVVENHLISSDVADLPDAVPAVRRLPARALHAGEEGRHVPRRVHRARLPGRQRPEGVPDREGTVCGIELPEGLVNSSKLPEPIFTPSTKAEIGDHDENISLRAPRGDPRRGGRFAALRDLALKVYTTGARPRGRARRDHRRHEVRVRPPERRHDHPGRRGADARLVALLAGRRRTRRASDQPSFDKQFVRDWLTAHWDQVRATRRACPRTSSTRTSEPSTSRPTRRSRVETFDPVDVCLARHPERSRQLRAICGTAISRSDRPRASRS